MIYKRENINDLYNQNFHDWRIKHMTMCPNSEVHLLLEEGPQGQEKRLFFRNYLGFQASNIQPWSSVNGFATFSENGIKAHPVAPEINHIDIVTDVCYLINTMRIRNRDNLEITYDSIFTQYGRKIDLSTYFGITILLSSGDTIDIITDEMEIRSGENL